MKKPSVSDVALVLSTFVLLFQIFCHFILPNL
nr:MAG TPA: ATP synthase subunit 9 [Caudoviricetes sp.]